MSNFDDFFRGYLIAALWSSTVTFLVCEDCSLIMYYDSDIKECLECGGEIHETYENLDDNHSIDDIDEESKEKLKVEAKKFYDENNQYFKYPVKHCVDQHVKPNGDGTVTISQHPMSYNADSQAGHDAWLSSHHHGTGFFDRDELTKEIRDMLQERAEDMKEFELYIGDDNKIYVM